MPTLIHCLWLLCSLWIFSIHAEEFYDPTRPFNWTPPVLSSTKSVSPSSTASPAEPSTPMQWAVSLILVSPQRQAAIVNGHLVQVGALVGNAQVVAITRKAVVIEYGKQRITLPITKIQVKAPAHHVP